MTSQRGIYFCHNLPSNNSFTNSLNLYVPVCPVFPEGKAKWTADHSDQHVSFSVSPGTPPRQAGP